MIIRHAKRFRRDLKQLSSAQKLAVANVLRLFSKDPFASPLRNHKLSGQLRGLRAFSAGFDLRIIYREEGNHAIVLLLRAGTHRKVYGE